MPEPELEKLLGGFAADTLTPKERETLFRAALHDQQLFNALADEQALKDKDGSTVYGASLPRSILKAALYWAQIDLGLTPVPFGPPASTGDLHPPGSR